MAKKRHARKRARSYATNPPSKRRKARPTRHWKKHKVYQWNPKARRRYRRNPGDTPKDIAILVGTGVAAAVLAPKLASKLPGSPAVKNIAMIAAGAALAFLGRRKNVLVGIGAGLVVAGATRAITNQFPQLVGDNEFSGDEQQAILQHLAGDELSGPMAGPMEGDYMDGDDFLNGPMEGDYMDGDNLDGDQLDGNELLGAEFNAPQL